MFLNFSWTNGRPSFDTLVFHRNMIDVIFNFQETGNAEVLKKKQYFTGEAAALDEEAQRKKREEEEMKEQRKKEFQNKSSVFNQSTE